MEPRLGSKQRLQETPLLCRASPAPASPKTPGVAEQGAAVGWRGSLLRRCPPGSPLCSLLQMPPPSDYQLWPEGSSQTLVPGALLLLTAMYCFSSSSRLGAVPGLQCLLHLLLSKSLCPSCAAPHCCSLDPSLGWEGVWNYALRPTRRVEGIRAGRLSQLPNVLRGLSGLVPDP